MADESSSAEAQSERSAGVTASFSSESWIVNALTGRFRWVICALLFLGVTKNYMDRGVLGVLKVPLQHAFGWDDVKYGHLIFVFQMAYALGMLCVGRLIDRLGTRIGYAVSMIFWSLASMAHAANVGAIATPLFVPWIAGHLGWRWAFLMTGALGFAWLILWLRFYRKPEEHRYCTIGEREYIQSDPVERTGSEKIKWRELLPHRQTWTFATAKFLTDPIWWFYLFWIPDYMQRQHGLHLGQIGLPILVIYVISDLGSVAGGWLSSSLIRKHFSVNASRKWAMLICALSAVPVAVVYRVSGLWPATLLIGLAAAGHQGFSANLFTLTSDLFPSRAVASVAGIGGMAGAVGGMLIAEIVGHLLQWTGSYMIPFFMAASAYLIALLMIHLLSPRLIPARIGQT